MPLFVVMANPKRPAGVVSKRFLAQHYGFNARHTTLLVQGGVLVADGTGIVEIGLDALREGEHYVVCRACGSRQAAMTTKHVQACSGMRLAEYVAKFPDAPLASTWSDKRRAKSDEQRQRQADILRRRFRTPCGQDTRDQIAEASRRLMQTGYRDVAAQHLTLYNQAHREDRARESKARWADPVFRSRMQQVHRDRHAALAASAAHARGFITRTFTKPHQALEEALLAAGVQGLVREHVVGFYRVDEAIPDLAIAIEVDGCYWHGCPVCGFPGHPGTRALDQRKTTYLCRKGWRVLRIPEHRITQDLTAVVRELQETTHGRADQSSPA